jgi:beta-mannosidase
MNKLKCLLILFFPFVVSAQHSEREINSNWQFRQMGKDTWMPAKVPGSVHIDLQNNKIIPDPFFADNVKKVQWIENEDWEYQTEFTCSSAELLSKNCDLKFDGLDTYAKVFLNGKLILEADNMFRTWKVDVKKYLKQDNNVLLVKLFSPLKIENAEAKKLPYTLPDNPRVFTRKAAFHYGWDFAPRLITCGIWKPVYLCFSEDWSIVSQDVQQQIFNDSLALLTFYIKVHAPINQEFILYVTTLNHPPYIKSLQKFQSENIDSIYIIKLLVKHPKFWWCNGYGSPNLYHCKCILQQNNSHLDQKESVIGIRKIELVREADKVGESFYFKLNGVPIFMKGANIVPLDMFPSRVSKQHNFQLVKDAADAHMNMLRVWGGGIYPDDEFYKNCDEQGILVWQDLMFAGAMYPCDTHFVENVKSEVKDQIARLKQHPSLALWCGNNEIDEAWKNWGWQKQFHISNTDSIKIWQDYVNLFQKIFPQLIAENDEEHKNLYWSTSPSIGWGRKESLLRGDAHYWGVWWGEEKFDSYKKKVGRFMSEYGFQSLPAAYLFQKWMDTADIKISSEAFKNHQKHAKGFDYIQKAVTDEYKTTEDINKQILLSQFVQAKGMKTAIEAHRRAKPYCMGTLFWQLNDCWPSISWSAIDIEENRKALYYQAKRSFEKILISFNETDKGIDVYIVSDEIKNTTGNVELKLCDLSGKLLWSANLSSIQLTNIKTKLIYTLPIPHIQKFDIKNLVFVSTANIDGQKEVTQSFYYFTKDGELSLLQPQLNITKISEHTFTVSSDVVAKNVYLHLKDADIKLSDNFFDLLPGNEKIIKIEDPKTFSEIENKMKVTTLYELMK